MVSRAQKFDLVLYQVQVLKDLRCTGCPSEKFLHVIVQFNSFKKRQGMAVSQVDWLGQSVIRFGWIFEYFFTKCKNEKSACISPYDILLERLANIKV